EITGGLADREVVEDISLGIPNPGSRAGARRKYRPVGAGEPGLRQTQGEDKHIKLSKEVSHSREMLLAVSFEFAQRGKTFRDQRSERIDVLASLASPWFFSRIKLAKCPLEKL